MQRERERKRPPYRSSYSTVPLLSYINYLLYSVHCPNNNLNLCITNCPNNNLNLRITHCPHINLNLRIKTEPVTAGADATVYVRPKNPDFPYCICSSRNRLAFLCGDSDFPFGTVRNGYNIFYVKTLMQICKLTSLQIKCTYCLVKGIQTIAS